ncbi:hypothetical protein KAU51_03690 [Candidatus Parcubacteria bacterium]|nr:hypothetical protein [Candidatus Parcubacteria bacterium]
MDTLIETTTTVTLKLAKKEALWLKGLVQNPIGCSIEEEDPTSKEIRRKFWDALIGISHVE